MQIESERQNRELYKIFLFCVFFGIGAFLRLDSITMQFLLDDEWHSIYVARRFDFGWLFSNYVSGATSIPLNVYKRAVLLLFGWNELSIRLPNLLSGIALLAILPVFLRRIANLNVSLWFLFFLSISPFIITYSISSRPYAIFVLLSFLSLQYAYSWFTDGGRSKLIGFFLTGCFATYFHLFALPTTITCLLYGIMIKLIKWRLPWQKLPEIKPKWHELLICGIGITLLIALFYYFPYRNGMLGRVPSGGDTPLSLYPWLEFYEYLCGTTNMLWICAFGVLAMIGAAVLMFSKGLLLFGLLVSVTVANIAAVIISSPALVNRPIVFTRYCIILLPVFFVICAFGGEWLREHMARSLERYRAGLLLPLALALLCLGYLWNTPIRNMLVWRPNNFLLHSAYIESYHQLDWKAPYISQFVSAFGITKNDMSKFYHNLAAKPEVKALVEYPMPFEDSYNIYYYYQHFHKKRIYVAYLLKPHLRDILQGGDAYEIQTMGSYLYNDEREQPELKFTNLINVENQDDIIRTGASYFVVHKNYFAEIRGIKHFKTDKHAKSIVDRYKPIFGQPVFEDLRLWVFEIQKSKKITAR